MKLRQVLSKLDLKLDLTDSLLNLDLEVERSFDTYVRMGNGYKLFYAEDPRTYIIIYDNDKDNIKLSLFYTPFEGKRVVGTGYDVDGNLNCLY